MSYTELPEKDPGETIVVSFVFGNELQAGETVTGVTASATVFSASPTTATDPNPSAILGGLPTIAATSLQQVHGGIDGNRYSIEGTAATSAGRVLVRKGLMTVTAN